MMACYLQTPFNKITYEIVGDGKAPRYFKVNKDDGKISIARSLREDQDLGYVVSNRPPY